MKIHVIGSGSSVPSAVRANSSYLVVTEGLRLIDCSGSPAHSILALGYDLSDIRGVFITHAHVDHIYALPSLIHSLWGVGAYRDKPLPVYAPDAAIETAKTLLGIFSLESRKNAVRIDWRPLGSQRSGELALTSTLDAVVHPLTHGTCEAVGYQFGSVLFTGDCIYDARLDRAAAGIKSVFMDCGGGVDGSSGHAGAKQVVELMSAHSEIEQVFLTHIHPSTSDDELSKVCCSRGRLVKVLKDGDLIEF